MPSESPSLRRGSCPGVFTPMMSGDGLLLRVRTAARALSSADLHTLATLAQRHANGQLELTRRANIQLRGVRELEALQAGLVAAGLAQDAEHERRVAALMVDPLSPELADVAAAIEAELLACDAPRATKLAIIIEADRGTFAAVGADLRVREYVPGKVAARVSELNGKRAPLKLGQACPSLLGDHGAFFGVALPFGSADADTFHRIAELAPEIRVAADRVLLLFGARAVPADLIADERDPLRSVIACPGAPACSSAHGDTRTLARELAGLGKIHVSGCEKGCAHSGPAPITLVRAAQGARLAFDQDVLSASQQPVISLAEVRKRVADVRVRPPMSHDYVRDGAEIYRRSFAIIRAEAKLDRFSPVEERVAVRLIHTSGMVDLADDIVFTPGFAEAARTAIRSGAPILCDAKMIVSGVTRSRLSANNELLCFLDQPGLAQLARELDNTRSAAALEFWRERLAGAVVAIGNAPTALFRLLELFDQTDLRPAAVIGLPVGFVGAAESKQALLDDGRVPAMVVRGRRGGSAMTVAAINALASDEE